MPRALPRCHSLKSMRSGRSRCRTNGFWDKSPALRPTDMTASGSCTGRPRSRHASVRPNKIHLRPSAASPRRRYWYSISPAICFATGGGPGEGFQWPQSEHGIFIDDNDFVWLAGNGKNDGQLLKFTMDGKFVLQIGKQGEGNDSNSTVRLGSPADVAVDVAAKEVFAADGYANRRVVVFDSETGNYKRHWGAYGKPPSDERTPPYDPPQSRPRSSATRCIASASTKMISSTSATASTTACRCSTRMALSSPGDTRHGLGLRPRVLAPTRIKNSAT